MLYVYRHETCLINVCYLGLDDGNEELLNQALHPVQEDEIRSCLRSFARSMEGIRLSESGRVVVGDTSAPEDERKHCGSAVCGIRCIGRYDSNTSTSIGNEDEDDIRGLGSRNFDLTQLWSISSNKEGDTLNGQKSVWWICHHRE